MNTSAKGRSYEWAFRDKLLKRPGVKLVQRAAASKGLFDLIAVDEFGAEGWQCKSGRVSCRMATTLVIALYNRLGMPQWFGVGVVHRTKENEFCEH